MTSKNTTSASGAAGGSSGKDAATEEVENEQDTVAPLCTCGHGDVSSMKHPSSSSSKSSSNWSSSSPSSGGGGSTTTPTWLESSFVHLLAPRRPITSSTSGMMMLQPGQLLPQSSSQHQQHHGYLEAHQHLSQLWNVATQTSVEEYLCMDCMDRIATALESDTNRLFVETQMYQDAIRTSKLRNNTIQHVIPSSLEQTELTYQNEIAMLQQEVDAKQAEYQHLTALYEEQLTITQQLNSLDEEFQQEQNSLELQSRSFDNTVQLKTKNLYKIQTEVDRLLCVRLPNALFDLQVDEQRGLRYPLINQLRLAYRPKGDVPLKEIQVAWSQATQLLLMVGTLLQYPSSDWKLVPLADCAKLIYRKEIYNLSPGDCRGLIAWNALLDQVIKHAKNTSVRKQETTTKSLFREIPYPSSYSSIGSTDLTRLDRLDHVGWSQVIHRMASNLLWLSDCASDRVAKQVGAITYCIV